MNKLEIEVALLKKEIELRKEFAVSLSTILENLSKMIVQQPAHQPQPYVPYGMGITAGSVPGGAGSVTFPGPLPATSTVSSWNSNEDISASNGRVDVYVSPGLISSKTKVKA